MADSVYTQADLDAARASLTAAKSVSFADRRVDYRSVEELERLIYIIQDDLGQLPSKNNGNRFSLAGFSRS